MPAPSRGGVLKPPGGHCRENASGILDVVFVRDIAGECDRVGGQQGRSVGAERIESHRGVLPVATISLGEGQPIVAGRDHGPAGALTGDAHSGEEAATHRIHDHLGQSCVSIVRGTVPDPLLGGHEELVAHHAAVGHPARDAIARYQSRRGSADPYHQHSRGGLRRGRIVLTGQQDRIVRSTLSRNHVEILTDCGKPVCRGHDGVGGSGEINDLKPPELVEEISRVPECLPDIGLHGRSGGEGR